MYVYLCTRGQTHTRDLWEDVHSNKGRDRILDDLILFPLADLMKVALIQGRK